MLYAAGSPKITVADVQGSRQRRDVAGRLGGHTRSRGATPPRRCAQLALALEAGGVPYMILGQLAWFVARSSHDRPAARSGAVEALFRTDLDLKSSEATHGCCSSGWWWSCAGDCCERADGLSGLRCR